MSRKTIPLLIVIVLVCWLVPAWAQSGLPPGNGSAIVERTCTGCHGLNVVTRAGHSRSEWGTVLHMMMNVGAKLSDDEYLTVLDYLSRNFPANPHPSARIINGTVDVSIEEWNLPTPGSRPHDPLVAPDGMIWYTGQMANLLGRFDPKTMEFKEFHLQHPDSGPHGLVADKEGNIWFTANFAHYIGKLDPATGKVTEYPLDPKARDPHTPLFAPDGMLFFTAQGADMIGRLDPKAPDGNVKLVTVPTPRANPYGMVINSKGIPFFAEFGSNKIARIDPVTMEIHEYPLPNASSRPRRVAITPDDAIWYTDYARGYLGRLDPNTGNIKEWPSPSGPDSRPYGITAVGNIIWYSETNTNPNTVVRFDPRTQAFQTWALPSGGGVVRNMVHTPDGDLWLACSGVNQIALVHVHGSTTASAGK